MTTSGRLDKRDVPGGGGGVGLKTGSSPGWCYHHQSGDDWMTTSGRLDKRDVSEANKGGGGWNAG